MWRLRGLTRKIRCSAISGVTRLSSSSSPLRLVLTVTNAETIRLLELSGPEGSKARASFARDALDVGAKTLSRTGLEMDAREVSDRIVANVSGALGAMEARREESNRSTRRGVHFETALMTEIRRSCASTGDALESTGGRTGRVRHCKIGDGVLTLSRESAAPGERIVIEAKRRKRYPLDDALKEMEKARANRDADVGLFVFSRDAAPDGADAVARYGNDVVVLWDHEDPSTDVFLKVGLSLSRALCVRRSAGSRSAERDEELRTILPRLESQVQQLDQIETWASTIRNNSEKIMDKVRNTRKKIDADVSALSRAVGGRDGV